MRLLYRTSHLMSDLMVDHVTWTWLGICIVLVLTTDNSGLAAADGDTPQTTSESTSGKASVDYLDYGTMTADQQHGVVTIEYEFVSNSNNSESDTNQKIVQIHKKSQTVIADILANSTTSTDEQSGQSSDTGDSGDTTSPDTDGGLELFAVVRRRRDTQTSAAQLPKVDLVRIEPPVKDDRLRTSIVVTNPGGEVMKAEDLEETLKANQLQLSAETGETVKVIYVGRPEDVKLHGDSRPSIWDKHFWMFFAVLILWAVALLVLIICCLCFRCGRRCRSKSATSADNEQQPPLLKKTPVDEPAIKLKQSIPAQQTAPPPGGKTMMTEGAPSTAIAQADDENGWIIPLDQLSADELNQPDVQISRL